MKYLILFTIFFIIQSVIVSAKTDCEIHRERESRPTNKILGRLIPECDENGNYKPLQCHGDKNEKKRACQCWNKNGDIISSPSFKVKQCSCILKKKENSLSPSAYQPSCELDGSFKKEQCHQDKCWCVDSSGKELSEKKKGSGFCK